MDAGLLKLPRHLGEFVIVHELVHLLCPEAGHGRVFKAFLSAYWPQWAQHEQELQRWAKSSGNKSAKRRKISRQTATAEAVGKQGM